MQSALRPVFFLKDHQAGSKKICETERTNCQPESQSRMAAFYSPPQLPPCYPFSSCLSTRLSSSSPSTGHNYSMKKNDFPKQHHPPTISCSVESVNLSRTSTGDLWRISPVLFSNQKQSQSHYFMYIYMLEMIENCHTFHIIHLFLQFDRTLIVMEIVNFTHLITNFPSKATTITGIQTITAASSFHIWGYI